MKYFIDGMEAQESDARESFEAEYLFDGGDPDAVQSIWIECHTSEEARDSYLPSHIELIA